MAERYRISYRKSVEEPLQFAYRDDMDEVVDWLAANGGALKQIFIVREEGPWTLTKRSNGLRNSGQ